MKKIFLLELGKTQYEDAYEIQKELVEYIGNNEDLEGFFILTEHDPVFTIGKSGSYKDFLYPIEKIRKMGIEIYDSDRGGKITYHGLGQIVGYPILNLKKFKVDLRWYVDSIEEMIIKALKAVEIKGEKKGKYTGIWVGEEKICAIGIRFKRWITMHGFALNFDVDLEVFKLINPCGITEFGVTSARKLNPQALYADITKAIKVNFEENFNAKLINTTLEEVRKAYGRPKTYMD